MSAAPPVSPPSRTPLQSLRRFWLVPLILIPLCAGIGVTWAARQPTTYTAEARLAVGPGEMSTGQVAGFPQAARDLAASYARWVQNTAVDGTMSLPSWTTVTASPIPESNVIRIEAWAQDPKTATAGADAAATSLLAEVNKTRAEVDPKTAYQQYLTLLPKVAAAEVAVRRAEIAYGDAVGKRVDARQINAASAALADAKVEVAKLGLQRDALAGLYQRLAAQASTASELRVVKKAAVVRDDTSSRTQRYGLGGFGVGLALALLLAVLLDRRPRKGGPGQVVPAGPGPGPEASADPEAPAVVPGASAGGAALQPSREGVLR